MKAKANVRYAILANKSWGLYAGVVKKTTPQQDGTLLVEVGECRHVARWFGRTGGITSLAAYGLCGPDADKSRVGGPADSTLSGIVNIFNCSDAARDSLRATVQV